VGIGSWTENRTCQYKALCLIFDRNGTFLTLADSGSIIHLNDAGTACSKLNKSWR
jgi:hypothetical protein